MSLSKDSPITFSYREELSHDEYHIPLIVTAFDPVTYIGAPLGDYGATAFASLSIIDGDRILGDYTAKAYVTMSSFGFTQNRLTWNWTVPPELQCVRRSTKN